jgi:hypothetical protein
MYFWIVNPNPENVLQCRRPDPSRAFQLANQALFRQGVELVSS